MATSEGKSYLATGNINPASFVKVASTTDFAVAQATLSTDILYGVAQQNVFGPPGIDPGVYAASAGQQVLVYHQGDVCLLVAGTAGFTAGDDLSCDGNGYGITAVAGQSIGAIALQTTINGVLGRVEVKVGKK